MLLTRLVKRSQNGTNRSQSKTAMVLLAMECLTRFDARNRSLDMATSKQIDYCISALAVAYPLYAKQQANPDLARTIYHRVLSDVDGELLEAATMQWLSTDRPFHPSPGELRDMA